MISAVVFSLDRPCQLHLLLESLEKNAPGVFDPTILCKWTNTSYRDGYNVLAGRFPNVHWYEETNFFKDLSVILMDTKNGIQLPYMTFFTDDSVLYRPIGVTEQDIHSAYSKDVACVSLRLGQNIRQENYWDGQLAIQPAFSNLGKFLKWNAKEMHPHSAFGYIFSVDGHILRTSDVIDWMDLIHYCQGPNDFEGSGAKLRERYEPNMLCLHQSALVSIPANRVQSVYPNHAGIIYPYSIDGLNEYRYLRGEVINLDAMDFSDIRGTHHELIYDFKEYKG